MNNARFAQFIAAIAITALVWLTGAANAQQVAPADEIATRGVISDQIGAFVDGDHARAYSHAAPAIKRIFPTVDRFIAMVRNGYMPLYRPRDYDFGRNIKLNGEVYQEVIVTDEAGKQWQAVYTLRRQADGSWKVTGVKMEPYSGASA